MTNTPISEIKNFFAGNVNNAAKGQDAQMTESFSEVFGKTQSPTEKRKEDMGVQKTEHADSIQNHAKMQKKSSSKKLKEQTEDVTQATDTKMAEQAMENVAGVMVEQVAKTFDMTVEEVEAVMEELGLSALDLLNGENLTQVVIALNPGTDAFSIMTDEDLFADFKGLMNTAQNLLEQTAEQLGMSQEELTAVWDTMSQQIQETAPAEETGMETKKLFQTEEPISEISVEVTVEETMESETLSDRSESETVKTGTAETKDAEAAESVEETIVHKYQNSESTKKDSARQESSFHENAGSDFKQQVVNQLTEAVENVTGTTASYGVNGEEILRQITDYIKVNVTADTTEMELQLHPASLGNIKVQIASAGGVMTATFTTENETVKAALESQLIQLKDNFEQQGLKVENVEVNVSAQAFERNLDQQEQGRQNAFDDKSSRSRSRRIRLNGLEENEDILMEDMTEGDRIVADMMLQNGNSVDYTV